MAEPDVLSTRKTFIVLVIVAGCFAVIWPRVITPLFADNVKEQIRPNKLDKATGCCDMFYDKDINAIRIMTQVCSSILEKQNENLDHRTKQAIQSGKLPKDIIATCRKEVNATCGIDIATLLDQNVKLGKSYKQILDAVRSYNGSSCLKTHFGVSPWELGVAHYMSSGWVQDSLENVKQERPPHLHTSAQHPAMRERGRAIMPGAGSDSRPSPPSAGPVPLRREGRVGSPLSVYYEPAMKPVVVEKPVPVPGMRPPMGGAGHVVPAPKSSSVGFIMPVYTIAMVIFFFYTLCRLVFKKTGPSSEVPYAAVEPDSTFRRRVFEDSSNRHSPETNRLGKAERDTRDEELDMLKARLAETERAMERIVEQLKGPLVAQETQSDSTHSHTNGSVKKPEKEQTPEKELVSEIIITHEYTSVYRESPSRVEERQSSPWHTQKESSTRREGSSPPKEYSPAKEYTPQPRETTLPPRETTPPPRETTPPQKETTPPPREQTPEREKVEGKGLLDKIVKEQEVHSEEEYSDEEISYEEDELPSENEAPLKPIRSSAEPENKTVKVVGMELTAHCAGGGLWGARPATPPAPSPRPHTPAAEVSSIFLEGSLPHQSRLLVADSETHTQKQTSNGKDSPVILSGKMTLSVINDEGKESPERVTEESAEVGADDHHISAGPANTTPEEDNEKEELSDDWLEEVIEEVEGEDDQEAIVPQTEEEIFDSRPKEEILVPQLDEDVEENIEVSKYQEVIAERKTEFEQHFPPPEQEVILPHPEDIQENIQEEFADTTEQEIQQEVAEESDADDEEQEQPETDEEEDQHEINFKFQIEKGHDEMSEEEIEEEVEEEAEEEEEDDENEKKQVLKNQEEKELEVEIAEKQVKREQEKKEQEEDEEQYEDEEIEEEVEEEEIEVSQSESEEEKVEENLKLVSNHKKLNGTTK